MIQISEEKRAAALQVLTPPKNLPPMPEHPAEHYGYLKLAETETVEMPPVEGFPWKIYVVRAKNRRERCPIHINVHGGGWVAPHRENDDMWSSWLAHQIEGIVVDVDYTTTQDAAYPVCFDQCYEAAKWTVGNCTQLGGDPRRISMGGYSAGGHLTALTCLKAAETDDFQLCLQVLGYLPTDLKTPPLYKPEGYDYVISPERSAAFNTLLFGNDPELAESPCISPMYAENEVLAKTPRALIISAGHCNFRFEDEDYACRLASLGVETTLKRFPEARHGFIPHLLDGWEDAGKLIAQHIRTAVLDS